MTEKMMDLARQIIIKARTTDTDVEELVWEILLMGEREDDPAITGEDDIYTTAVSVEDEAARALAWVEAREQMDDPDAFECRGFTWRQVL
jgi:hypothetical protein